MKHFSFLLFASLFCSTAVFAQKNTLSLGVLYLPKSEYAVAHGAIGYFRQVDGNHSMGLKGMFSTDGMNAAADQTRFSMANLDLAHRWTLAKRDSRKKWIVELGVSAAWMFKKIPPDYYSGFCATGMTAQEIADLQEYYENVVSKWHTERKVYTGIASALAWEYTVSNHFGLGLGATFNAYFSPKDGWQFLPMPHLNASYSY